VGEQFKHEEGEAVMGRRSFKEEILSELDKLPSEQQQQALLLVRALAAAKPRGVPGKTLLRFAGIIALDDLDVMGQAIEEECEEVDHNDW
jgi:hypothetical protein